MRVMGGLADVHPRTQGKGGAAGTLLYLGDVWNHLENKENSSQTEI